ncbi:hypothetical protein SK128_015875, partial [Halocaridina rubra]
RLHHQLSMKFYRKCRNEFICCRGAVGLSSHVMIMKVADELPNGHRLVNQAGSESEFTH